MAFDWSVDLFTSDFFNPYLPASESSFSQDSFQPTQLSPPPIPSNSLFAQGTSPFLEDNHGVPDILSQSAQMLAYDNMKNCNHWCEGETGTAVDVYPSVAPSAVSQLVLSLPSSATFPPNWVRIPQKDYSYGRKQLDFKQSGTIFFSTEDHPGVNLRDALRKEFTRLNGRDDPMLRDASGVISCRLLFPGYPDNGSSCQKIHTLNWTKNRKPIPRSKLAFEIARKLDRYLTRMTGVPPDGNVDSCWRIGHGFMHIDNMFLVSLASVSLGSFQPEIWVAVPPTAADPVDKGED